MLFLAVFIYFIGLTGFVYMTARWEGWSYYDGDKVNVWECFLASIWFLVAYFVGIGYLVKTVARHASKHISADNVRGDK